MKHQTISERCMAMPRLHNIHLPSVRKFFGLDLSDAEYREHLQLTLVEVAPEKFAFVDLRQADDEVKEDPDPQSPSPTPSPPTPPLTPPSTPKKLRRRDMTTLVRRAYDQQLQNERRAAKRAQSAIQRFEHQGN